MAKIDCNGMALEYDDRGHGDPIVLVHGSASDNRTWDRQRTEFSGRFRTITYSRRYHWPNEEIPDGAEYRMDQHVEDLLVLLRSLDVVPAHLVGHSYGAYICLILAVRDPASVRTMVLEEAPVVPLFASLPPKPSEMLKLLLTSPRMAAAIMKFGMYGVVPAIKAFSRGDSETGIRRFGRAVFGRKGFRRLSRSRLNQVRDNIRNVEAEIMDPGFLPLNAEQVKKLHIPSLLINGKDSIRLFTGISRRLHRLLPNSELVEISGASHLMHEQNATAYNTAVMSFLDRNRRGE